MKTSTFFVPALLAMTLVSGAAFAGNAISAPHGGGHGGPGGGSAMGGCMMGDGPGYHRGMGDGSGYHRGMGDGSGYHRGMGDGSGYHRGMGGHMGRAYDSMTPERRVQFDTMLKDYHSRVLPMGDALYVKKEELRALQNAATPDVNAVSQKATEINELHNKVRAEKDAFMNKLESDLGIKDYTPSKGEGKAPKKM